MKEKKKMTMEELDEKTDKIAEAIIKVFAEDGKKGCLLGDMVAISGLGLYKLLLAGMMKKKVPEALMPTPSGFTKMLKDMMFHFIKDRLIVHEEEEQHED